METAFVEAVGTLNWGKFMVGRFTEAEWRQRSEVDGQLLVRRGWSRQHLLVLDLETGEGTILWPHETGMPSSDLNKHKIWVCPMFEPFLEWLYVQDLTDLSQLPSVVELLDHPGSWAGYRRAGE